jgi:hypothetical protein
MRIRPDGVLENPRYKRFGKVLLSSYAKRFPTGCISISRSSSLDIAVGCKCSERVPIKLCHEAFLFDHLEIRRICVQAIAFVYTIFRHSSALRFFAKATVLLFPYSPDTRESAFSRDLPNVARGPRRHVGFHDVQGCTKHPNHSYRARSTSFVIAEVFVRVQFVEHVCQKPKAGFIERDPEMTSIIKIEEVLCGNKSSW